MFYDYNNNLIIFNFFVSDKKQSWGRTVFFRGKTLKVMCFTINNYRFLSNPKIRIKNKGNHHFFFRFVLELLVSGYCVLKTNKTF